jgi:N-acetylmuramate 1-kinase
MANHMIPPPATDHFLAEAGWGGAIVSPLAGDASFRRYFRVALTGRTAVLMDAPPPHEDPRPFVRMSDYLCSIGLAAPAILHRDLDQGLLLIEDFGSVRMRETVDAAPEREHEVYEAVINVLIELHRHAPPEGLQTHGLDAWVDEVCLFTDWYCPAVGIDVDRDAFRAIWAETLGPIDALGQSVTELRDFHAENIMLVEGATGHARIGLLDFQDALIGHPAYDLVSMLEDARRDVSPSVERAMLDHYVATTNAPAGFEAAYWALGAQRNTRIIGVFTRLWKRDSKPHYTAFQPRMWGLLERNLAQPGLESLRHWFDQNIPQSLRASHWIGREIA